MMQSATKAEVDQAIAELHHTGIPEAHRSNGYCLVDTTGLHLPPKLVLALARRVSPNKFSGGRTTNSILEKLGYTIKRCSCGGDGTVRHGKWKLSWRVPYKEGSTKIGRIIVDYRYKSEQAGEVLDAVMHKWPAEYQTEYLIACGGFIEAEWPRGIELNSSLDVRNPPGPLIAELIERAKTAALRVLTPARCQSLSNVKYLSFGVDFYTDLDSSDDCPEDISKPHIEFVGMLDLKSGEWTAWTGKFYPVPNQERHLLRVTDVNSHFKCVGEDRVMLLGCNDLTIWNLHGAANRKPGTNRSEWCETMTGEAEKFRPTVVLHHPHRTHSALVWAQAWVNLKRKLPTVQGWSSAIRFSTLDYRKPQRSLDSVLRATHGSDTLDVVVSRV